MSGAPIPLNVLVEGIIDEAVVRRIVEHAGLSCIAVYGRRGKPDLLRRLSTYNQAARFSHWLVVVDLDRGADCAPAFIERALPDRSPNLHLRVAVRAVEAWLLADADHLAAYLGTSRALVTREPDTEADPKTTLVNLARRSGVAAIRHDWCRAKEAAPELVQGMPAG